MKNSSPWDKFILLVVGLIVIGLAALFLTKALSFGDRFGLEPATPDDTLPPTDVIRAEVAKKFVDTTNEWKSPVKGAAPKPLPLFVSIPIVEIEGKLIDMLDPQAPSVREPVSNAWLMNNDLDFLNKGVLDQDPDGDGFTNLEEWEGKTEPRSADSHPPYVNKLVMISRQQTGYTIKFAARPDAERFQIIRLPTRKWPKRETFLMRVGDTSEDQQFRIDSFEEKKAQNSVGVTVDASVLNITYLPKGTKHQVVRNINETIPTYYAELDFLLEPFSDKDKYVKEGETFSIARDPQSKYRVTKVEEDSVTITYETALLVRKKQSK